MRSARINSVILLGSLLLAPWAARADNVKGRVIEPGARWRLTLNIGDKSPIEGGVQETERPFDEVRTEGTPQAPESFTFEELGLSESESTYGLSLEYRWKWFTLFADSTFMEATATGAAPRDFFIGVKEVTFDGREYEYQKIGVGETYEGTLDLLALNVRAAFTPVTVNAGGNVEFVPWIFFGIFTLAGQFDLDAGPATGVELYENPPREYVVGGRSDGDAAAFAPEFGLGGEVTFRTGERSRLSLQANLAVFEFTGSTGDLGISSRNEKDLDFEYTAYDAKAYWDFPMTERTNFLVSLRYAVVEADGLAEAQERTPEEVAEIREKFNKRANFSLDTLVLGVGLRW